MTSAEMHTSGHKWLLSKPGIPMDAIQAARWFDKEHGTGGFDWHMMAQVLDEMRRDGTARRTGYASDGLHEYKIIA